MGEAMGWDGELNTSGSQPEFSPKFGDGAWKIWKGLMVLGVRMGGCDFALC